VAVVLLAFTPPQKGPLNFDNYAGYIAINEVTNKSMYYWFVTSQRDPANDPVILWLQGGPGCSDFGDGFLQENGPFLPYIIDASTQTVGLVENFYSWNRQANMIFVDSPV
jgi:carboxypeptidase C (cathepsin A)